MKTGTCEKFRLVRVQSWAPKFSINFNELHKFTASKHSCAIVAHVLGLLLLASCVKKNTSLQTSNTDNPQIQVELLFTHDGCKVYRFYNIDYRYFTNCTGSTTWTENCGKNCTREAGVQGR